MLDLFVTYKCGLSAFQLDVDMGRICLGEDKSLRQITLFENCLLTFNEDYSLREFWVQILYSRAAITSHPRSLAHPEFQMEKPLPFIPLNIPTNDCQPVGLPDADLVTNSQTI